MSYDKKVPPAGALLPSYSSSLEEKNVTGKSEGETYQRKRIALYSFCLARCVLLM